MSVKIHLHHIGKYIYYGKLDYTMYTGKKRYRKSDKMRTIGELIKEEYILVKNSHGMIILDELSNLLTTWNKLINSGDFDKIKHCRKILNDSYGIQLN